MSPPQLPPQLPAHCHSDYSQEVTEEQDRECRLIKRSPRHYEPPEGQFASISAGLGFTCGVREDRSISCWGDGLRIVHSEPAGAFRSVSAG